MKRIALIACLLVGITFNSNAQNPGDTIVVESFNYSQTYSDMGRDSVINFPDLQGITFEKILMQYNMRCKDAAVNTTGGNGVACGEWDYTCNTYLHDSSRVDSILYTHPTHTVSGYTGSVYNYTTTPTYTYYNYEQQNVTINSTTSEVTGVLNNGATTVSNAISAENQHGKSQYLLTAAELTTAGLSAGDISGLQLDVTANSSANFLRVRIKSTAVTTLDETNIDLDGFTEVYFSNFNPSVGMNQLQFYTPFNWDGTSNLIVEFNYSGGQVEPTLSVNGDASPAGSAIASTSTDRFAEFAGSGQYIDAPDGNYDFSNGFSVSAWVYYDSFGNWSRIMDFGNGPNSHNILFANRGTTSDLVLSIRVGTSAMDLTASGALVLNEWMHVAATIDASGNGTVYVNGNPVQTGTSQLPANITRTNSYIGRSNWNNDSYFDGKLDEVSVWNTALSQTEIQNWMFNDIDASHPNYANLMVHYNFNDGNTSSATDGSSNATDGTIEGYIAPALYDGRDIFKNLAQATDRPNLSVIQGVYDQTVTTVDVLDSVQNAPNVVTEYEITPNPGTLMDDDINPINTNSYWQAVTQVIYNAETGAVAGTLPVTTDGSITIGDLDYFRRWPSKFEIMSFVTPYGIGLDMGPNGKTWTFDMTDFAPVLKGAKRMTMEGGGQRQEDMDIKFLFIVGTPPSEVIDIQSLWRTASRGYQSITSDQFFPPRDVPTNENGEIFKVRTSITGHGQEGEFIPQNHFLDVNGGSNEFNWSVWKECAENPVYPQGGTWIYDRAGWCPGMATDVQMSDITEYVTPGESINLDYGVVSAQGTSNYYVSNLLVTYGAPNHTVDAAVVEVREPSNRIEFDRFNSVCHSPKVVIRNTGSETLTRLTINYWINDDSTPETYIWTGSLDFMETEEVVLPSPVWLWNSAVATGNVFHVEIEAPNDVADEYAFNNTYDSHFDIPEVMPSNIIIWFRTNNAPNESSFEIVDDAGNVIHSRSGMDPNTLYRDTVALGIGCYTYNVYDTGDDGIAFWANSDGSGYTRFQQVGGAIVKTFEPDFGDNIHFNFTSEFPLSYEEINGIEAFTAHPNPTNDELNISLKGFNDEVELKVINHMGQVVQSRVIHTQNENYNGSIHLDGLANGMYLITVSDEDRSEQVTVVKE